MTSFPVASPPHHHRSTWSQSGAASNSHPAPVGISTPVGLGGSWGKNTWFRLCWSTLDRRSSTTLTLLPSSYKTTTTTTASWADCMLILQFLDIYWYRYDVEEFKSLIRSEWLLWRGVLLQLLQGGHHHQGQGSYLTNIRISTWMVQGQ